MRNPLQEQLLKAGPAKKFKVAEVAREQLKQCRKKRRRRPTQSRPSAHALKAERDRLMEAVKTHSLGQISHALYDVGGEYRRNM